MDPCARQLAAAFPVMNRCLRNSEPSADLSLGEPEPEPASSKSVREALDTPKHS